MTSSNLPAEPITSEPVIINTSDAQNPSTNDGPAPTDPKNSEQDLPSRLKKLEEALEGHNIRADNIPPPPPPAAARYYRGRSRSRSPSRVIEILPFLSNTSSLNNLLEKSDTCAEIQSGPDIYNKHVVYITNNPFHTADLEKISWILKIGVQDSWVQKPVGGMGLEGRGVYHQMDLPFGGRGRRNDYIVEDRYDDRYDRNSVPVVRLGNALRVLKDDKEAEKVKFVIVVQGKGNAVWAKLIISHSRQGAMVDIFHEIMSGQSVLFVGAVLRDVKVPVEVQMVNSVTFQKVEGVGEAEGAGEGVVGVIC